MGFAFQMEAHKAYALLKAATLWVSTDDTRPHLRQVQFAGNGKAVSMTSTNGHGLWHCAEAAESSDKFEFCLKMADVAAVLKLAERRKPARARKRRYFASPPVAPKPEEMVVVSGTKDRATVSVGRYSFPVTAGDGFPPVDKVMAVQPTPYEKLVGLSARYLSLVARSLPGTPRECGVKCIMSGQLDPCVFEGNVAGIDAKVILMPVRV